MFTGLLQVACKFRGVLVDSATCDQANEPPETRSCQTSECTLLRSPTGASSCTTVDGQEVDYSFCEGMAPPKDATPVVVYLLFEGSAEDTSIEMRRQAISVPLQNAITHWVVENSPNISKNEIMLAVLKGEKTGIRKNQFLVQMNITSLATSTESTGVVVSVAHRWVHSCGCGGSTGIL